MPKESVLFVGDFIMPFVGAPFVEEGDVDALVEAMTLIDKLDPETILHGHQPLTQFFSTPARTRALQPHVKWLAKETRLRINRGQTRVEIHRANLYPQDILNDPLSQQFYLALREQIINRIYDKSVGYWESDLSGLDTLDANAYGVMLSQYLSLNERKVNGVIQDMLVNGDYHLAERFIRWALARWPDSAPLKSFQKEAALKLRLKYQAYNPFKFILYSELADSPVGRPGSQRQTDR